MRGGLPLGNLKSNYKGNPKSNLRSNLLGNPSVSDPAPGRVVLPSAAQPSTMGLVHRIDARQIYSTCRGGATSRYPEHVVVGSYPRGHGERRTAHRPPCYFS